MTIQLSIERPVVRVGNPPGATPGYRVLPAPSAANDAAAAHGIAMPADVPLPTQPLRSVRYAVDADEVVARVIAAAVAAVGAVALLETVARFAALYA